MYQESYRYGIVFFLKGEFSSPSRQLCRQKCCTYLGVVTNLSKMFWLSAQIDSNVFGGSQPSVQDIRQEDEVCLFF